MRALLPLLTACAVAAPSPDAAPRASDCAGCHPAEHAAWTGSRHAIAATNPTFHASWTSWPNGWCLGCHAPGGAEGLIGRPAVPGLRQPPLTNPVDGPWQDGVGCPTCHLDSDVLLTPAPPTAATLAAHEARHEPAVGDERLCARCHEFTFQNHTPLRPFTYGTTPAQATVSEWRSSDAADQSCASCHLRGHTFAGPHTPGFVAAAVQIEARRDGRDLLVTLSADAPHRIPSGDPFRRIEVRACVDAACSTVLARHDLRRHFRPDATSWTMVDDTTIPPSQGARSSRQVRLPVGTARHWQVAYRFGDRRFESQLPPDEVGFVLASGPIPRSPR